VQNWKNFTTNNITIWDNARTNANVYLNKHYRVQIYVGMDLYKDFYVKYSYVYESKLPLVYFNTTGRKGTCNDKIYQNGNFKIIVPQNNVLARVTSDYNDVMKMKLRGSTSCSFPQQPYTFKFLTEDLQKKNEELANTITGFLSPALEGVFESLVKGEDPFESLKNSVEQLIIQLGKAVIQSLILKAVTSAIGGPAFGVAGQTLGLGTIRGDAFSFLLSRGR
jgi:hypothetical protein